MLVLVAVVAVTIVATRDYVRVQAAREQMDWQWANLEALRVPFDSVVAESYRLHDVEGSAFWISRRTAAARHVLRLKRLLNLAQSPVSESSLEMKKQRSDFILDEIRRYDPEEADKLAKNTSQRISPEVADKK
jgi:hypothetical protein